MRRQRRSSLAFLLCAGLLSAGASSAQAASVPCPTSASNQLLKADDPAPREVALPSAMNFWGKSYTSVWVTNHGQVDFTQPDEDPAFGLYDFDRNTETVIAPFLGDVDTSATGTVTWGETEFEGQPAFCVDWKDVGYFSGPQPNDGRKNTFQLLLVKRGNSGDFDMVFNYDRITWDAFNGGQPDDLTTEGVDESTAKAKVVAGWSAGNKATRDDFQIFRNRAEPEGSLADGAEALTAGSNINDPSRRMPGRYMFDGCDATVCPEPVVTPTPTPTVPRPTTTTTPTPQVTPPAASGSVIATLPPVQNTIAPTILGRAGKLRFRGKGTLLLPVTCSMQARGGCTGTVTLKAKGTILGRGRLAKLAPGRTATVRITLSRKGRALLKKSRTLKVTASAVLRDGAGTKQTLSSVLTVRGARR